MRYLALRNFHGSLSFQSIMISGQLTTSNYRCTGAQRMKLNGKVLPVYTIERRMHEECGLIHNTKTYMTQSGYILRHDWLEIPYLVQINSLIDPNDLVNKDQNIVTPLRSRWRSDIQMMSMYLDKKTCQMAQQTEYLTDHPEIKQLISDFTQTLLAVKPVNVLSFTVQHFAAFAKNPDLSKVGPSGESNLDIMSQLSTYKPRRVCSVCGICFECLMSEQPPNNVERKRTTRGSKSPAFSTCSVFTKCPSDAICVRKLSDGSDPSVTCSDDCRTCEPGEKHTSICSLHPECLLTCEGCQHEREPCQVHKDCPECLGCRKVCSFYPQCKKTCEGCRIVKELCRVHKDCPECPGCRNLCSFHPECEKTCDGCRMTEEKPCNVDKDCNECPGCLSKICSFHPECEETCEGCQPVKEPCRVHKACPECPGCHKVCSEIGVCSNCVKCNIEILPESAKVVFNLDSEN
ncbi:uncharacterized protein [Neodiprion pinetum]|uniref:uncharacterized protein isoform X1 n=1 Tax=Neodiprion pinetum TaxID=441929 RepID=UPI001EE0E127|nr:uncharacterized protein LOC124218057 isoform X1 [Neodiprion pinetum]